MRKSIGYELALTLIKENKRTRSTSLSLDNCGLQYELPHELLACTWIERLYLGKLTLHDGFGWPRFTYVKFSNNAFRGAELASLYKLPNLKELFCSGCSISDISFVSRLKRLKKLDLSDNAITDIGPLENLLISRISR